MLVEEIGISLCLQCKITPVSTSIVQDNEVAVPRMTSLLDGCPVKDGVANIPVYREWKVKLVCVEFK